MTEGDELLDLIRQAVRRYRLEPDQERILIELVARTVITIMSDPHFLMRLNVVIQLTAENQALRQHIARSMRPPAKRAPAKKKAAPKKAVKKAPAVRVRGSTPANRQAFRKGYRGS